MKLRKRVTTILRWANLLLILATFLAYLSPYINPDQIWVFSFFGLAYPLLLLFNILFVLFWMLFKDRYFLFSLGCIVMGLGAMHGFIGLNFSSENPAENDITVMSFNMRDLLDLKRLKGPQLEQKSYEFLRYLNSAGEIDILCGQEIWDRNIEFIAQALGLDESQYYLGSNRGLAILSVYPMLNRGEIRFKDSYNSSLWADLVVKGDTIRVYSTHLQSTQISSITDKVIEEGDLQRAQTWRDLRGIIARVKFAAQRRAAQARRVAHHVSQSPYPVILGGDFNDPPQSYAYRTLSSQLCDTFLQKGKGLGTTYAGHIPALRIDYILVDKKLQILDHSVLKGNYSDHYPVVSNIRMH